MAQELILEIGTEEIPARFTPKALEDLADLVKRELGALEIVFGKIQTMGTPRRLVLCVDDVGEFQKDAVETKLGPPKHLAFDEKGNPTKAARGFAEAQGIPVEDLETVTTERGEYLRVLRRQKGRKTSDVLRESLPQIITSIPFLKSMRWGINDGGPSGCLFSSPRRRLLRSFSRRSRTSRRARPRRASRSTRSWRS